MRRIHRKLVFRVLAVASFSALTAVYFNWDLVVFYCWDTMLLQHYEIHGHAKQQSDVSTIDSETNATLYRYGEPAKEKSAYLAFQPSSRLAVQLQFEGLRCWSASSMTVVTGYFNIGTFAKGSSSQQRTPNHYFQWLSGVARLVNPVVFFTDDEFTILTFERLRKESANMTLCTKTFLVRRDDLWPWRLLRNISEALRSRTYVYSPPDTTYPPYSAATCSKYPLTELAVLLNPFGSRYFAWLDVGIFRNVASVKEQNSFAMFPPADLPDHQVGYLEVRRRPSATAEQIFLKHIPWIAGGMFFGSREAVLTFVREYSQFAHFYMTKQLVGADQQVLAAMFAASDNQAIGIGTPSISLRLYRPRGSVLSDPWFYLVFKMREIVNWPTGNQSQHF